MNNRFIVALSIAGIFWSLPALSHHSRQAYFLVDEIVTIEGVVTEFLLVNPHARIYFDVVTPDGDTEAWMTEGNAASALKRYNWTDDTFKKGDFIRIIGNPSRDGSNLIEWIKIILPDGRELFGGNGSATQGNERRIEHFERRRKEEAARRNAD